MSIGGLLAIIVLLVVIVALVFRTAAPDWLDLALDGLLALAVLLTAWPLRWAAAA